MEPQKILVLAEIRGKSIHPVTYELLHWGLKLAGQSGATLSCAVLGIADERLEELVYHGAERVLAVNPGSWPYFLVGPLAGILVQLIREEEPSIVIAAATAYGRTLLPVAAARLGTGLTADCTELAIDPKDGALLQTRPAIGGNVMATIKTSTRPQMATVRPRSLKPAERDLSRNGEVVVKIYAHEQTSWPEKFLAFTADETSETSLQDAEIVVTGGKGMKSKNNFRFLEELAGLLGAGLGATRDAVEAGWAPFFRQIGLTGKTVSPKLYIAAGVAGKIQHLAGMLTSEYIIAINEDPEAQIFKVADLGIIADAPATVKSLTEVIKKIKNNPGEVL
ncbi:MAG: electron transfer flavoprotein subunit alpha/FixB family protein [Peptococcaceae bacterium]|nr:MAG: electron transfer flavoprotein subunit alpha/FixB family protein [Peptococcaceae bacterium]